MGATPIVDFLRDLTDDPTKCASFMSDPVAYIDNSSLTASQKEVMKSQNPDAIRDAIQDEVGETAPSNFFYIVIFLAEE